MKEREEGAEIVHAIKLQKERERKFSSRAKVRGDRVLRSTTQDEIKKNEEKLNSC